jgi:hypothetical protein
MSKSKEFLEIPTRPGISQGLILARPMKKPVACVILFAGGPGKLKLGYSHGAPVIGGKKDFLVRTMDMFSDHGLMVALVDSPSDLRSDGMSAHFRINKDHTEDMRAVIGYMKNIADVPVWLVGTSRGTFSVTNCAVSAGGGIDGIVLTSCVTRSSRQLYPKVYRSHPHGILDMHLEKIAVPTLIIAHRDDQCYVSPPSNIPKVQESLMNAPKVEVNYFNGGRKSSSEACSPLSAHGFYGIEAQVVSTISEYVASLSRQ